MTFTDTTSAADGILGPYTYAGITSSGRSQTVINNNVWNVADASPGWTQVLNANNPGDWEIVANLGTVAPGAIISYPDAEQHYDERPLSSFASILVNYTENMNVNEGSQCEAAFDCWFNDFQNEIMVWVDTTANQASTLAFDVLVGTFEVDGLEYTLYHRANSTEWIFYLPGSNPSLTIDLLKLFYIAMAEGAIAETATLTAIELGWEIVTTGGQSQTFTMSEFTITEVNADPVLVSLNMAGNKIFGLPDATGSSEAVNFGQLPKTASDVGAMSASGGALTAGIAPKVINLTANSNVVAIDGSAGNLFSLPLTSSSWTIETPIGMLDGEEFYLRLIQDSEGGRTVSWAPGWYWGSIIAPPVLSTSPGAEDLMRFVWNTAQGAAFYADAPFPQGFSSDIRVVQVTKSLTAGAGATFDSGVTEGNSILLAVGADSFGSTETTFSNPTLGGDVFSGATELSAPSAFWSASCSWWLLPNITSDEADSTTIGVTVTNGTLIGVIAYEVEGLGTSPFLDHQSNVSGGPSEEVASGFVDSSEQTPEIVFGMGVRYSAGNLGTPSSDWTTTFGPDNGVCAGFQTVPASGGIYRWQQTLDSDVSWASSVIIVAPTPDMPVGTPTRIATMADVEASISGGNVIAPKVSTLSFESIITPDASDGNVFYLTLTGNCTINAPINGLDGQHLSLELTAADHTVTWGSGWNFGSSGEPNLTSGKTDIISAIHKSSIPEWRAGCTFGF